MVGYNKKELSMKKQTSLERREELLKMERMTLTEKAKYLRNKAKLLSPK